MSTFLTNYCMNNFEYLFEDYKLNRINESLEDNNYMTLIPTYTLSDFDGDNWFDYLCNDEEDWGGQKGVTADNSGALENVHKFTMYLWVYYDKSKEKEKIFDHFYDDFLAYSFSNEYIEKDLEELYDEYDIEEPYERYLSEKEEYESSSQTGNAEDWENLIDSLKNILLGIRYSGKLTLYRVICPIRKNGEETIDIDRLGNCWSYKLSDALRFEDYAYNHVKGDTHPFVVKATCHPANIDWVRSLMLKFEYPKEVELRVMDSSKLYDVEVFDIDGEKRPQGEWIGDNYVMKGIND